VGDTAHLSIRPERPYLSEAPTGDTALLATVTENIFIGTDITTLLTLENGIQLTVRSSNSDRGNKRVFEAGRPAHINVERGAARLLTD
jgi:spermidine/putrescine transport system ATP-binding protein